MAARGMTTQVHFLPRHSGRALLRQPWAAFMEMRRARRTRRLLTEMDDRMLADIGIGRADGGVARALGHRPALRRGSRLSAGRTAARSRPG